MSDLFDPLLVRAYAADKRYLEKTHIPIVTVSGTFREDVKDWHQLPADDIRRDIVFSRAHFSMALGVLRQAWGGTTDPTKAWMVDPTNYVAFSQYQSIAMTETIGKLIARLPLLQTVKAMIDKFGRSKLPILKSITPPLLFLTEEVKKPILSFHIAAGNLLLEQGKKVIQVITDPHVRPEYVKHADNENLSLCVFDQKTKDDAIELAGLSGQHLHASRVIVTGPPIDERILASRRYKAGWRSGPLHLCITTGGIGTNKPEIEQLLETILPQLRRQDCHLRLLIYAGTQTDIADLVKFLAKDQKVKINNLSDAKGRLRLIYHPQLFNANELLIQYGFPWAHGFITKPSGDMAYDAVASGSFLLTLQEWGEWEHSVRAYFEQRGISREAVVDDFMDQITSLMSTKGQAQSWIERAMNATHRLEPEFYQGGKNIVKTYQDIK